MALHHLHPRSTCTATKRHAAVRTLLGVVDVEVEVVEAAQGADIGLGALVRVSRLSVDMK